jgi:crossover junction endodeoxyribonuclease RuvC
MNDRQLPKNGDLILGVDPGSTHTGYGLIEANGSKVTLVSCGRISPNTDWPLTRKLCLIHRQLVEIVNTFKPKAMALEDVFTFKNPRSAIKLAQARGVSILAAALFEVPVFEYAPALVKNSVTGNGRAEKSQVAFMVQKILNITQAVSPDTSDALAVALCHSGQSSNATTPASIAAASRNRGASWRKLSVTDLAELGYQVEKPADR